MASGRGLPDHSLAWRRFRLTLSITAVALGAGIVLWSPLIMYRLLGRALPWKDLADVGEAYGGASALLSAAALCGIGFSLILQSRQMRQELISLDKQRHFDLIKLALDNPEFFEVIDIGQVSGPQDRKKVYANLMLNYWLAIWELGEIGEAELRNLTANMFEGEISREWWRQQDGRWMTVRTRRRRRFMTVVREEWDAAEATAAQHHPEAAPPPIHSEVTPPTEMKMWAVATSLGIVGMLLAGGVLRNRATRRRRTSRP